MIFFCGTIFKREGGRYWFIGKIKNVIINDNIKIGSNGKRIIFVYKAFNDFSVGFNTGHSYMLNIMLEIFFSQANI